jgi:hypothetical protein
LVKSAQSAENKRVEFSVRAKKCKITQKSAQEYETKAFRYCHASPGSERMRKLLTEQGIEEIFRLKKKKPQEAAAQLPTSLSSAYTT